MKKLFLLFFIALLAASANSVTFNDKWQRSNDSIFVDTRAAPVNVGGTSVGIYWLYPKEVASIAYKQAYLPFSFQHNLLAAVDPCAQSLGFTSSYSGDTVQYLDTVSTRIPYYTETSGQIACDELIEGEFGQNYCWSKGQIVFCENGIEKSTCNWVTKSVAGYTTVEKQVWRNLSGSCPVPANTLQQFRHSALIGASQSVEFDVNADFVLAGLDAFTFVIPKPAWFSTAPTDYNAGYNWDFNYVYIPVGDANIMPTGELDFNIQKTYPTFDSGSSAPWVSDASDYGPDLNLYFKFNGVNDNNGAMLFDDTNHHHDANFMAGVDLNGSGLWDTNAAWFDGVDDFFSVPSLDGDRFADANDHFTVSAWIKFRDLSGTGASTGDCIASNYYNFVAGAPLSQGWYFYLTKYGTIHFDSYWGSPSFLAPFELDGIIPNEKNKWYHVTAVCGGFNNSHIYVNGVEVTNATKNDCDADYNTSANSHLFGIGAAPKQNFTISVCAGEWEGEIEEFKVYSKALSKAEVQADYNAWTNATYYSEIKDLNFAATSLKEVQWKSAFGSKQAKLLDSVEDAATPFNVDNNLMGWYDFDSVSGTTVPNLGEGGAAANGTIENQGGAVEIDANAISPFDDHALYVGGGVGIIQGYVEIPMAKTDIEPSDNKFTFTIWVKPTSKYIGSDQDFVIDTDIGGLIIRKEADETLYVQYQSTVGLKQLDSTLAIPANQWSFVAMRSNATNLCVWVNGVKECCACGSPYDTTTSNVYRLGSGSGNFFEGELDEFRVYHRTLADRELEWLYAKGLADLNVSVQGCTTSTCSAGSGWIPFDYGNDLNANLPQLTGYRWWQWKASFTQGDMNYPIGYGLLADVNLFFNRPSDLNILKIADLNQDYSAHPFYSYVKDANLAIDFNFFDGDGNAEGVQVDINYSANPTTGTGINIVKGLPLLGACATGDWNMQPAACTWDWNTHGVADNNYYINISFDDDGNTGFKSTKYAYGVDNNAPAITMHSPAAGTTQSTQTIVFDLNEGFTNIETITVYYNSVASTAFLLTNCTHTGTVYYCAHTEPDLVQGDVNLTIIAQDTVQNELWFSREWAYTPTSKPPGGGGGPSPVPPTQAIEIVEPPADVTKTLFKGQVFAQKIIIRNTSKTLAANLQALAEETLMQQATVWFSINTPFGIDANQTKEIWIYIQPDLNATAASLEGQVFVQNSKTRDSFNLKIEIKEPSTLIEVIMAWVSGFQTRIVVLGLPMAINLLLLLLGIAATMAVGFIMMAKNGKNVQQVLPYIAITWLVIITVFVI